LRCSAPIGAVSIATPFLHVQYTQALVLAWPNIILTAAGADRGGPASRFLLLRKPSPTNFDYQPFLPDAGAVRAVLCRPSASACIPTIVPQSITIWKAASPENSQLFMLFGVAVLVPLILGLYRLGLLGFPRQG